MCTARLICGPTAHVAVKVMRHLDSWSIYRFVEEFSWLSQLNHPHLVKLYDAFSEGDTRYFFNGTS